MPYHRPFASRRPFRATETLRSVESSMSHSGAARVHADNPMCEGFVVAGRGFARLLIHKVDMVR